MEHVCGPAPAGYASSRDGVRSGVSFSGTSVNVASVSSKTLATETAFSSASRRTLVGSMMPASTRSTYSPFAASNPNAPLPAFILSTTPPPSTVTDDWRSPAFPDQHGFRLGAECHADGVGDRGRATQDFSRTSDRNDSFLCGIPVLADSNHAADPGSASARHCGRKMTDSRQWVVGKNLVAWHLRTARSLNRSRSRGARTFPFRPRVKGVVP